MKYSLAGKRRRVTDEQVRQLREWKSLARLAKEIGIAPRTARMIREGYQHKQRSP